MPSGVKDIQLLELKDTISQLNKTISTQNELISSLQKMLEERNAKDSEKDLLIANLQSQLAYLKNKVFGSTSEIRHDQLDGQLNLFGTPVGDEKPAEVIEPEVISVKGYTKERKPKATYDDKYNSVRSICKHFFTDIVGLSIKFFCVSLRHMSIIRGIIAAVGVDLLDEQVGHIASGVIQQSNHLVVGIRDNVADLGNLGDDTVGVDVVHLSIVSNRQTGAVGSTRATNTDGVSARQLPDTLSLSANIGASVLVIYTVIVSHITREAGNNVLVVVDGALQDVVGGIDTRTSESVGSHFDLLDRTANDCIVQIVVSAVRGIDATGQALITSQEHHVLLTAGHLHIGAGIDEHKGQDVIAPDIVEGFQIIVCAIAIEAVIEGDSGSILDAHIGRIGGLQVLVGLSHDEHGLAVGKEAATQVHVSSIGATIPNAIGIIIGLGTELDSRSDNSCRTQ